MTYIINFAYFVNPCSLSGCTREKNCGWSKAG